MARHLECITVCDALYKQGLLCLDQIEGITTAVAQEQTRLLARRRAPGAPLETFDLVQYLVSLHLPMPGSPGQTLGEERIMRGLAEYWGVPFCKIDPLQLDLDVVTAVLPRAFATRHLVMPLAISSDRTTLTVATTHPHDMETLDNVCKVTNMVVKPVVSTRTDILKVITEFYGFKQSVTAAERLQQPTTLNNLRNLEQYTKVQSIQDIQPNDRHIINAVDFLFNYAFDQRASDIHIEPKREQSLIRLRIDGVLNDVHRMPRMVHPAFVSRVKTLARLDIAEKRRPQDGRIKVEHNGKQLELRVSTMPVAFDEKVVIRVFDPDVLLQALPHLGFTPPEYAQYVACISRPHGIMLITGPTGSGKTSTLYATLGHLATPEINIVTIEDPIEMVHEQFNQVAVQPAAGITFATALRTILRQDPDVIMVGEIRDYETAEHAVHAALTGHLVLSTLHTNDAPSAIARLTDLGVPAYLVESTLIGVLAQRLVRKVCGQCQYAYSPGAEECTTLHLPVSTETTLTLRRGAGCVQCRSTGYFGRTGIYELMPLDNNIRRLIRQQAGALEVQRLAREAGMQTLRDSALQKLRDGITTTEEVLRITHTL